MYQKRLRRPKLKDGELRVYWGKLPHDEPDVIFEWKGEPHMRRDSAMLSCHMGKIISELSDRGYDITTLKLSVMKTKSA